LPFVCCATAHRLPAGWDLLSNISHLVDFIDAKNRDLTLPLRDFLSMFVARTAHCLPAGWNLPSNISHLVEFIGAKNRDLTVPLRGSFPCLLRGQRTAYRRVGISYRTRLVDRLSWRRTRVWWGAHDRQTLSCCAIRIDIKVTSRSIGRFAPQWNVVLSESAERGSSEGPGC